MGFRSDLSNICAIVVDVYNGLVNIIVLIQEVVTLTHYKQHRDIVMNTYSSYLDVYLQVAQTKVTQ